MRCERILKKGLMTEPRRCMRSRGHRGGHTPNLLGMQFTNLSPVSLGKPYLHHTWKSVTWNCIDNKGRMHANVGAAHLIAGASRGIHGPFGDGGLDSYGYRRIQRNGRTIKVHREVMAKIIGRPLRPDEDVHHGLKGRACNDPDNLSIRLKGKHPTGHSIEEMADWLRSLGCRVSVPKRLRAS